MLVFKDIKTINKAIHLIRPCYYQRSNQDGGNMKNLIWALPLAFITGCGDKEEDTGVEEAQIEDTADSADGDTGSVEE